MTRGVPFKWTPERHFAAVDLRNQKWTLEQIGKFLGCSLNCVFSHFQKHGIDTTRVRNHVTAKLMPRDLNEIEQDLEKGVPSRLIAAKFNMAPSTLLKSVVHKDWRLKSKLRKPGAPKATPMEQELALLHEFGRYNLPLAMIAIGIKRSVSFLSEKLASDEENPWKEAYWSGRIHSSRKTAVYMETKIDEAFAENKDISPAMLGVIKHWDNRMNGVGEKVQATFTTETSGSDEVKMAERALLISDRQMALITAGKLDYNELLSKDKMQILDHARKLEEIPEAEWWDHVGGAHAQ